MRRLIVLLALLVSGLFLTIGAAPASAANCSSTANPIQRYVDQGYQVMGFYASIHSCTQVEAVRWYWKTPNNESTGFADCTQSYPTCTTHQAYINGTQQNWTLNNPGSGINSVWVAQTCWWVGGAHQLTRFFYWQIKNSVTHTWGSTRVTSTGLTLVTC